MPLPLDLYFQDKSSKYIEFTWSNLRIYGTEEQKTAANTLRNNYKKLIESFLQQQCRESICKVSFVGTTDVTFASDIDINLDINLTKDTTSNAIGSFIDILDTAKVFHHRLFKLDMAEMFDINIYATSFTLKSVLTCENEDKEVCTFKFASNPRQRTWSFMRAYDVLQSVKPDSQTLTNIKPMRIYQEAETLRKSIEKPGQEQVDYLKNYYEKKHALLSNPVPNETLLNEILENFSMSKYFEHETYRSIGAYLHVVEKAENLHYSLYIDAMLDNFGFLLDNLFSEDGCLNIEHRLLRVAKYLERMSDAIISYYNQVETRPEEFKAERKFYNNIKAKSNAINNLRKTNGTPTPTEYIQLYNALGPLPNIDEKSTIPDCEQWFYIIYLRFIRSFDVNGIYPKQGAGISKQKVFVLGRNRNVVKIERVKHVLYQKKMIPLKDARKIEKEIKKSKNISK